MLRLQPILRSLCLGGALLVSLASVAMAAHVAPVLPLTANSFHAHEKLNNQVFPAGSLVNIDLSFADLSNSTFAPGTDLTGANFTGANLTNASLAGCIVDLALFRGANLTGATLPCVGGADFRGAIFQGTVVPGPGCSACTVFGPNLIDQCSSNVPPGLCSTTTGFRAVVAGVVFYDNNNNGQLDFGEPGIPGAQLAISLPNGLAPTSSDGRGAYRVFGNTPGPGVVTLVPSSLPPGALLTGPGSFGFDLNLCRSAQALHFPVRPAATPAQPSTFGRTKVMYR